MRYLTIRREKSFVACVSAMKVYIEDQEAGDTVINNVPCRKLGVLKNGEENVWLISENEAKVYVIADKLSRNFCNEYYQIPAGTDNIFLSGKNRYNPASGNAFRFDGVTDEAVLANRKKGTKKGIIIIAVAAIVGFVIGFFNGFSEPTGEPKVFSDSGMQITLTDEFDKYNEDGFTTTYYSDNVAVFVIKEEFSLLEGFEDYTVEEYCQAVIDNNNHDATVQQVDGITYFEYEGKNDETGETFDFFAVVYKEEDAFWLIQFSAGGENPENYRQDFISWAKSVTFD